MHIFFLKGGVGGVGGNELNIWFLMNKRSLMRDVCNKYFVILSYNNFWSLELHDLPYQKKYLIDLDVSVCFESGGSCEISVPVLEHAALSKADCDWSQNLQGHHSLSNKTFLRAI